jgi:altronate dehydratase large subunit
MIAESVPGVAYLQNPYGCGQVGDDLKQTLNTLVGNGLNPNIGAVLVVGLGCESVDANKVADEIAKSGKPVETLIIQKVGGTLRTFKKGVNEVKKMIAAISKSKRKEAPLSKLIVGLECGGSDTTSGLISNPVVGLVSDKLISMNGTVIISEVPEFIGAEHLFAQRAVSESLKKDILKIVKSYEEYLKSYGCDFRGAQPSPGNIAGGITTIEEKSLGAIRKSGKSPVQGILRYAERPQRNGLYLMNTPGTDWISCSGKVAAGVQMILFTTGRGTPLGNPVAPIIKITGNPETAEKMSDNIDIDVSRVLSGSESLENAANRTFKYVIEVASGKLTKAEIFGHNEFGIFKIGPTF